MTPKFPLNMEKFVTGAVLAGCVVITLRTVRLLGGGVYLLSRCLKKMKKT